MYSSISWLRWEVEEKIRAKIDNKSSGLRGNVKAIAYSTTDASEVVLVLRSKKYDQGMKVIEWISFDDCQFKCKLGNKDAGRLLAGYTIPALLIEVLSDEYPTYTSLIDDIKKDHIPALEIRMSTDKRSSELEGELRSIFKPTKDDPDTGCPPLEDDPEFTVRFTLGNDDYAIWIQNTNWDALRSYLRQINGMSNERVLFCYDDGEKKKRNVSQIATFILPKVGIQRQNSELKFDCGAYRPNNPDKRQRTHRFFLKRFHGKVNRYSRPHLCQHTCRAFPSQIEYCKKKRDFFIARSKDLQRENMKKEFDDETGVRISLYQALIQILNSLLKYERLPGAKYEFTVVIEPLIALIDQIERGKDNEPDAEAERSRNLAKQNEMLNFLRNASSTIQNSVRSHRQFFSNHDIQIAITDISPKLLSMDKAFLRKAVEFLNEVGSGKHSYDFLFYPSVDVSSAKELILDTRRNHHLSTIKIDTRHSGDFRNLLVILLHEISHTVSTELRKRNERLISATKAMVYVSCLRCYEWMRGKLAKEEQTGETPALLALMSDDNNRSSILDAVFQGLCPITQDAKERVSQERINMGSEEDREMLQRLETYSKYAKIDLENAISRSHYQSRRLHVWLYDRLYRLISSAQMGNPEKVSLLHRADILHKR